MEILSPDHAQVQVDFDEAHTVSVGLIALMEQHELTVGLGAVAAVLTAGRLLSPDTLDDDEEVEFVKDALSWMGAYFSEGLDN